MVHDEVTKSFVVWLVDCLPVCNWLLIWRNCGCLSCHEIPDTLLECQTGHCFWQWLLHISYTAYLEKHNFLSSGLKYSFQVLIIIPFIKCTLPCFLWWQLLYNTYDYFTSLTSRYTGIWTRLLKGGVRTPKPEKLI